MPPAYLPRKQRNAARLAYARSMRGWYWRMAVLRWIGLAVRWLWRRGRTHWRGLAPMYAVVVLQVAGAVLSGAEKGYVTALIFALFGGTALAWRLHGLAPLSVFRRQRVQTRPTLRRTAMGRRKAIWTWSLFAASAVWLTVAARFGAGAPMPGLLLVGMLSWGLPWWWWHRVRGAADVDSRIRTWEERVACDDGSISKSVLLDVLPILSSAHDAGVRGLDAATAGTKGAEIGWTATAQLSPGRMTTGRAMMKVEEVASAYALDAQSVVLEPPTPRRADQVKVSVYDHNPLTKTIPWPGPHLFDPDTGMMPVAVHPDGQLALYRYYRRDSGPVHDLIAGTTDAGKSRLLDMLLSVERHQGMVSFVIDPQEGASLPVWKDKRDGTRAVHGYARNVEEGVALLRAVYAEMKARNRFMANYDWIDDRGRQMEGLDHFDPMFWAARESLADRLRLLCLTIDEAHEILNAPGGVMYAEAISKMARKCGIKLRLVTQVPLLDQLGNSQTLRDMVKAGNVIVLRTSTGLVGQVAFSGRLPVDPVTIPLEFEDHSSTAGMGYILGPGARPAPVRTWLVEDATHWATTGSMAPFVPLSRELAEWMAGQRTNRPATTGTVIPMPEAPSVGTVGARIVEYLQGVEHQKPIEIARALGLERTTVSPELARLEKAGKVHSPRPSWWAAGPGVEAVEEHLPERQLATT
jgi:hypothetical protein